MNEKRTKFIVMNENELIDIDTLKDWKNAEKRIKNRK